MGIAGQSASNTREEGQNEIQDIFGIKVGERCTYSVIAMSYQANSDICHDNPSMFRLE
jgi:hypothetical protein